LLLTLTFRVRPDGTYENALAAFNVGAVNEIAAFGSGEVPESQNCT
jgi:hypothetical protein